MNTPISISKNKIIFLINTKIILYHFAFIKNLWISKVLLGSIGLKSTEKNLQFLLILFFSN